MNAAAPTAAQVPGAVGAARVPVGRSPGQLALRRFLRHRLALFGIRKKFQRSGTGGAIILALVDRMRHLYRVYRLEQIEFGWVLEDNTAMRRPIELGGAQVDKIHRVYEKQLVAPAGTTKELAASSAGGNSETLTRGLV